MKEIVPKLPCPAEILVPQRGPMLVVDRLIKRDREQNFSSVEADGPTSGIFNPDGKKILPEYFMELLAQSMAAVNGYDSIVDGKKRSTAFLVGIDDFKWHAEPESPYNFRVEIAKDFEFGQVTLMKGEVYDSSNKLVASGEIKAWEESSGDKS